MTIELGSKLGPYEIDRRFVPRDHEERNHGQYLLFAEAIRGFFRLHSVRDEIVRGLRVFRAMARFR